MSRARAWRVPMRLAEAIDRVNTAIGRGCGYLVLLMVGLGAFNALARYTDRFTGWQLSSNAYLEAQWYLFTLVFLLAASYTLKERRHVRVDVFYMRLDARRQAWVDLLGSIVFLLPFTIFATVMSWPSVRNAWAVREMSPDPGGLPRYPIKTVILVAFALLTLQGLAEVIKGIDRLLEAPSGDGRDAVGPQAEETA